MILAALLHAQELVRDYAHLVFEGSNARALSLTDLYTGP